MRLLAFAASLAALAATAFAGQTLWATIREPVPPPLEIGAIAAQADSAMPLPSVSSVTEWPAIFGQPVVLEPQPPAPPAPPPPAEPQPPPAPPAPPIESLGYALSGLVSDGDDSWAIVTHPTGDLLLRVGDMLGESYRVTAIDEDGVWAESSPGATPQLLGFAK